MSYRGVPFGTLNNLDSFLSNARDAPSGRFETCGCALKMSACGDRLASVNEADEAGPFNEAAQSPMILSRRYTSVRGDIE